ELERAPLRQVRLRLLLVAESAIRHRERIVNDGRERIERQGFLEMLDGARVVLLRQRRASDAIFRGGRSRLKRQRLLEERLRRLRLALIEVALRHPDKRRNVVRLQLERARKRR